MILKANKRQGEMSMKIINSYDEIINLLCEMNGEYDLELYKKYTKKISPELYDKLRIDSSSYDFEQEVLPILEQAMKEREKLAKINDSFSQVVNVNLAHVKEIIGIDLPVKIVLYLGLCNGAGWATTLDGEPTILLGVEKMIEFGWCDEEDVGGLVYHELGHIWHEAVGTMNQPTNSVREKYIVQLYQEGIAMYFEQLCAGYFITLHRREEPWWSWCTKHKHELNQEYLRRLRENACAQDFFGDWCSYCGKSNIGYFLDYEFIAHLAEKYSLLELANLDIKTVYDEFIRYVEDEKTL